MQFLGCYFTEQVPMATHPRGAHLLFDVEKDH